MTKKSRILLLNIAFLALSAALLLFLWRAPEESTPFLPHDTSHENFFAIESKKEVESFCAECHAPEMTAPLSESHPEGNRCLFCHKRR